MVKAPKLPLTGTLTVSLAAIQNRPLYCIVERATEAHIQDLTAMCASLKARGGDTVAVEQLIPKLREWHIAEISGEFLTLPAARKNLTKAIERGMEAEVFTYSAEECRAACRSHA